MVLEDVTLDADLVVEHDPMLKSLQTEAMTNGDMFIPNTPPFKLYKTKIRHGTNKNKVETKVIGIKCTTDKVHLLKEYFSHLASPKNDKKQIDVFVPTRVVHLVGAANYAKIICNNNSFLQNIVIIPISDLQHVTLNIPFLLKCSLLLKYF